MAGLRLCLMIFAGLAASTADAHKDELLHRANPIRKVVNLLQKMQKKVTEEGEKAQELYEKFMCYCKNSGGELEKAIEANGAKTEELESEIKASEESLASNKQALKAAQEDRSAAKKTMSESTAMREKEAKAFASEKAEYQANIAALAKATKAIESGASGAFLQTVSAQSLQKLFNGVHADKLTEYDRNSVLSFLSGQQQQDSDYAPQSGEITGILKTMHDEMSKSLADITSTEKAAIKEFKDLMAAKTKEVAALTKSIETKLDKVSELGVSIAEMKNDLGDAGEALMEDKKFLKDMKKSCGSKTAEHEADSKLRNDELAALADTIKLLNDDDALELFKKTLPGSSASLLEVSSSSERARANALSLLDSAQMVANRAGRPRVDFIAMVLKGRKIGFDKVIAMIEEMIGTLKKEQADDDGKKEYCAAQFDSSEDKKKALEQSYKDVLTTIANTEEGIATTKDEIAALTAGIKALDKSVAEATEQRKSENSEYKSLKASDTAAKELLGFAKNRLNKFYNPKLYRPPKKQELSSEDRIVENMGGAMLVQVSEHTNAPPPAPETAVYAKKSGESGGVIAMIDLLIADLDKELTEIETAENDAQADYEGFLKDSQEKRTTDSKTLTDKESMLGSLEGELLKAKDAKKSTAKELSATMKFISSLHAECDWLLQYFDVRKEARTSEIDALGKAKAVLSGADMSLAQTNTRRSLRH